MLDYIYYITLKLFATCIFGETSIFCHAMQRCY